VYLEVAQAAVPRRGVAAWYVRGHG